MSEEIINTKKQFEEFSSSGFGFSKIEMLFLENYDLLNQGFMQSEMEKCVFTNCNFNGCIFEKARLTDCKFVNCTFVKAELNRAHLTNTTFAGCNFFKADFTSTTFSYCGFENCSMISAWVLNTDFRNSTFSKVDFMSAQIAGARLAEVRMLDPIRLEGALLENIDISKLADGSVIVNGEDALMRISEMK